MEVSKDSAGKVDAIPVSVLIAEVSSSVDQDAVLAAEDTRSSCPDLEVGSVATSVDLCLGQDVVDMDVDSVIKNEVAFPTADWDLVVKVSDTIEFLVIPDVSKKSVAVVG